MFPALQELRLETVPLEHVEGEAEWTPACLTNAVSVTDRDRSTGEFGSLPFHLGRGGR